MPYVWLTHPDAAPEQSGAASPSAPIAVARLWPHRSLTAEGFVAFFAISAALVAVPVIAVLGSPVVWAVLPFILIVFGGMWIALRRNGHEAAATEERLTLWEDRVVLTHRDPRRAAREWTCHPHWVRLALHPTGGPVPAYLTLTGSGRTVEIGAFLSEEERRRLHRELMPLVGRGLTGGTRP